MKYIQYFPIPFLEDLVAGKCIPFIGAGFSKNADIPSKMKMPLWDDLGKSLAEHIPDYLYSGALDAISAYEHEFSRAKLVEKISDLLLVNYAKPGATHKAFCEMPFDTVCTTNFEFLLEKSYEIVHRYCCPIVEEDRLAVTPNGPGVNLIKLHGDLHHPRQLIVTEDDYDLFVEKYPLFATYLANLLISKTAFFIGYSLDDPDMRHIWQIVGERLGKLRRLAYTVMINAKPHTIARFERRGIKVINLPGKENEYPQILEQVFKELREYWEEKLIEMSTITEETTLDEFSLPQDAENRLCFFDIPFNLMSFYKSYIFPIVEENGFKPITADEIISIGDTLNAKISALISRANVIVVDISSNYTMHELNLILTRKFDPTRILIVQEDEREFNINISEIYCMYRPKQLHLNPENFINKMRNWFQNIADRLVPILSNEPQRLFDKKEYRASVISAMTFLESELNRANEVMALDTKPPKNKSIHQLLDSILMKEMITSNQASEIKEWMIIRNKLVHSDFVITKPHASRILRGVYEVIEYLHERL